MAQRRATTALALVNAVLLAMGLLTVADRIGNETAPTPAAAGPSTTYRLEVFDNEPSSPSGMTTGTTAIAERRGPAARQAPTTTVVPSAEPSHGADGVAAGQPAGVDRGTYRMSVAIRSPAPRRADLVVDAARVASYGAGPAWRNVNALVFIDGPSSSVGVLPQGVIEHGEITLEPVAPMFTTRGTQVIGPDGSPFVPRGANRAGYEHWVDGGVDRNQMGHEGEHMARWGMNTARLPLNQELWLADCPTERSWVHEEPIRADGRPWTYRELIDEEIRRFNAAGLMVVLDLHQASRGVAQRCEVDTRHQTELPDQRSVDFWRSVATRYRHMPEVAFDLFNEPQLEDVLDPPPTEAERDHMWRNGGTVAYRDGLVRRTYTAVGMQRLYDTVREVGATNLVFVSGLAYALDVGVLIRQPLDATSIVASPHMYCTSCGSDVPNAGHQRYITGEAHGEPDKVGAADVLPVAVLEFGANSPYDPAPNAAFVEWMEAHGLGWAVHVWAPAGYCRGCSVWGILDPNDLEARRPAANGHAVWNTLASLR